MRVVEVRACQVIPEYGVAWVQDGAQVRAGEVGGVVCAEVGGAGDGGFGEEEAAFLHGRGDGLDVHDDEFGEGLDVGEGGEGLAPVDCGGDFGGLEGRGVEEVEGRGDAVADG